MQEIRLWFSLTQGVLYVHDYDDHERYIIIAIHTKEGWSVRLDPKLYGHKLILDVVGKVAMAGIVEHLNKLYGLHGHFTN